MCDMSNILIGRTYLTVKDLEKPLNFTPRGEKKEERYEKNAKRSQRSDDDQPRARARPSRAESKGARAKRGETENVAGLVRNASANLRLYYILHQYSP